MSRNLADWEAAPAGGRFFRAVAAGFDAECACFVIAVYNAEGIGYAHTQKRQTRAGHYR